jgi:hypothetical protein
LNSAITVLLELSSTVQIGLVEPLQDKAELVPDFHSLKAKPLSGVASIEIELASAYSAAQAVPLHLTVPVEAGVVVAERVLFGESGL